MTTKYTIVGHLNIIADNDEAAEKLLKQIYRGMWDLTPGIAEPEVTLVLYKDGTPMHKISASEDVHIVERRRVE